MTKTASANGAFDVLAVRDEIMDYLAEHSNGRQEIIADLVGLRRERICAYGKRRGALTDVFDVQRLYDWMLIDRKNRQQFNGEQVEWLITNARKNMKEATTKKDTKKWARKLEKYQSLRDGT